MMLAYVDETGNTGDPHLQGSTAMYGLGCVLVDVADWPAAFEGMLAFRRRVRETFGLPMRSELKANYLVRGSGSLAGANLAPAQRALIYRAHLRVLQTVNARAFAVLVDKTCPRLYGGDYFHLAWEGLLQRLERSSTYESKPFMIIHDEGENDAVRRMVRKARRHLTAGNLGGGGGRLLPATRLVEDPQPRTWQLSYFIQAADLVAYAAFRAVSPPGAGAARVTPSSLWGELGPACHVRVNRLAGGVPGIVVRRT